MVKPVNVNEMVLRVGALLRRAQMINERRQVIGNTVLECDSLTVISNGESAVLPQKEFMLLYKMASFPGRIFTRQQLMDDIWGYDSETDTIRWMCTSADCGSVFGTTRIFGSLPCAA